MKRRFSVFMRDPFDTHAGTMNPLRPSPTKTLQSSAGFAQAGPI
jgi:hypothetical protein